MSGTGVPCHNLLFCVAVSLCSNNQTQLVAQKLAIQQQIDKSQADSKRLETENKALIVQLELIRQQKKLQQMTTLISLGGLIPSKPDPSNQ